MFGRLEAPQYPTLNWLNEMMPKIHAAFPDNQQREAFIRIDKYDKSLYEISFFDSATGYFFSFRVTDGEIVDIQNIGVSMF